MTHLELLQTLPSPYREQAIENNSEECLQSTECKNILEALEDGFSWMYSPQGFEYWDNFYLKFKAGEFDKPKDPSVTLPMEDWERLDTLVTNLTHESPRFKEICALLDKIKQQLKP